MITERLVESISERQGLYNSRRGKTGPEKAEIDAKIELKNAEIKKCRHDIKLCNFITDNYEQMTENIDPSKEKQMREKSKYDLVKEELSRSRGYSKDYEHEKEI